MVTVLRILSDLEQHFTILKYMRLFGLAQPNPKPCGSIASVQRGGEER